MCEWFDETCGQLLDFLDARKIADDTIVIYLADNGWIQDPNANAYAPKSKQSPYDGGLRTPIVIRWPGNVQPAEVGQPRELARPGADDPGRRGLETHCGNAGDQLAG